MRCHNADISAHNFDTLHTADSVIISISQGPQSRLVNTTEGLKANARGLLAADEKGYTSRPNVIKLKG